MDSPPIIYASRLSPILSAVLSTIPLLIVSSIYTVREITRFLSRHVFLSKPVISSSPSSQNLNSYPPSLAEHHPSSVINHHPPAPPNINYANEIHSSILSPSWPNFGNVNVSDNDSDSQFNLATESVELIPPVPSPPPMWLTKSAFLLISVLISVHLITFSRLIYTHIHPDRSNLLDQFPWILMQQCSLIISWFQILYLFVVRQFRWHYTWVISLLWAMALVSSLIAMYTHAVIWTNPIVGYDAQYSILTWNWYFGAPIILDFIVPLILSSMAVLQFYRVSNLTRFIDDHHGYSALPPELPLRQSLPFAHTMGDPTHTDPTTKFKPPKSVAEYADKFQKLAPFVWPRSDRYLQWLIVVCLLLLIVGRIVNVLLPLQAKVLVDRLTSASSPPDPDNPPAIIYGRLPWEAILMYVVLRFLQGGVGLVATTQDLLWMPLGQYTTRAISLRMFSHLHQLSHRFHLDRKTGEILRVQDRGVSSIVSLLSIVLFNIVPTLIDIAIAVVFFTYQFDLGFGSIVFFTMFLYIFATVMITEIRTKHRRRSNALENIMQAKAVDSLLNFETVKLYNNEQFESAEYGKALSEYQNANWISSLTTSWLGMTQNLIIQAGLLAGALLCAHRVAVEKSMSVGDFVLYLSYITQLYGPLNSFGQYYRQLQKNFVDMEKMLDLLAQVPEVQDPPSTAVIIPGGMRGQIEFENVTFAYDVRVPTLKNVSFSIPAGQTVALVGSSGSGKSTILRLLFRFYDVNSGRISIDGVDIRHMSQHDLRNLIGVVPQDTVLFNDSIRYNIRYGRVTASDQEVEMAGRAAQIHDRIVAFPDQYETRVGERGMRLSGGERQRTSIARAILKNPVITFLDEATSALDTTTERMLQSELMQLTTNRTTLIIAHRLSTIIHADMILVVHNGEILERGSHDQLMRNTSGMYYDMWMKQLRDNQYLLQATIGSAPDIPLTEQVLPISPLSGNRTAENELPNLNVKSPSSQTSWIMDPSSLSPGQVGGLNKKLRLGASKSDIPKSTKTSPVCSSTDAGFSLGDSDGECDEDEHDQSEDIIGID